MKRKQRILSLVFLAAFALSACGGSDQVAQESGDYPFYQSTLASKSTIKLSFFKGVKDVPYLSVDTLKSVLESSMKDGGDDDYALSETSSGKTITLTRENKASCTFDFSAGTISFPIMIFSRLCPAPPAASASTPQITLMPISKISISSAKATNSFTGRAPNSF